MKQTEAVRQVYGRLSLPTLEYLAKMTQAVYDEHHAMCEARAGQGRYLWCQFVPEANRLLESRIDDDAKIAAHEKSAAKDYATTVMGRLGRHL